MPFELSNGSIDCIFHVSIFVPCIVIALIVSFVGLIVRTKTLEKQEDEGFSSITTCLLEGSSFTSRNRRTYSPGLLLQDARVSVLYSSSVAYMGIRWLGIEADMRLF